MSWSRLSFEDLGTRILSSVVLAAIGLTSLWMGGLVFAGVLSIAAAVISWEIAAMHWPDSGRAYAFLAGGAAGAALFSLLVPGLLWIGTPFWVAAIAIVLTKPSPHAVAAALAVVVAGFLGLATIRSECGLMLASLVVMVVIATDTGGYIVGRLVRGPKFWPAVSPNKTWSGVVGGWFLAVGVGMVYWMSGLTMISALLLAIVLSASSQIGDLAESAMKRRAGAKDGGRLIPGHGGLIDRFDGLVVACCCGWLMCSGGMLPRLVAV